MIILAAGLSSRFGTRDEEKLLADLDGKPMYRHILERLIRIVDSREDVDDLTIVCKPGEIFRQCRQDKRVFCVENRHPEDGISSSMRIGLTTVGCLIASEFRAYVSRHNQVSHTPLHDDHVLVCFVADEPYLQEDTICSFFDSFRESGKGMGAVSAGGATCNPCCFKDSYWEMLYNLEGDTGGKQLIRRYPNDVYLFELPESKKHEVMDIDYKEELPQ